MGDLARLHEAMGYALPPQLNALAQALAADGANALRCLSVHHAAGLRLTPWQQALIDKLRRDAGTPGEAWSALCAEVATQRPAGREGTALAGLQRGLFGADPSAAALDGSLQWLAVRDFLEETEVEVGMAQQALAQALTDFAALLQAPEGLDGHLARAWSCVAKLKAVLPETGALPRGRPPPRLSRKRVASSPPWVPPQ